MAEIWELELKKTLLCVHFISLSFLLSLFLFLFCFYFLFRQLVCLSQFIFCLFVCLFVCFCAVVVRRWGSSAWRKRTPDCTSAAPAASWARGRRPRPASPSPNTPHRQDRVNFLPLQSRFYRSYTGHWWTFTDAGGLMLINSCWLVLSQIIGYRTFHSARLLEFYQTNFFFVRVCCFFLVIMYKATNNSNSSKRKEKNGVEPSWFHFEMTLSPYCWYLTRFSSCWPMWDCFIIDTVHSVFLSLRDSFLSVTRKHWVKRKTYEGRWIV